MTRRHSALFSGAALLLFAACSGDDASITTPTTALGNDSTVPGDSIPADLDVVAGEAFPADRCELNKAAGPITYLSSFDYAASASIVDVLVAESKGYYEALCLDVEIRSSFSLTNYPLIAANEAQFSSAGSFSEMADFAGANDAGFVALAVEGRTGADVLITKDGAVASIADIKGAKIGVKGAITASVKAMLAAEGLVEGTDYETVALTGFDPLVHIETPGIVGFPGYRANEPLTLAANDIPIKVYDPSDFGIPGSFGIVYTNHVFLEENPTAAQDFMRATMRGLADAVADPQAAAEICVEKINANGNANFLSPEGEIARWGVESKLVNEGATAAKPLGVPQADLLEAEVTTYAAAGLFGGVAPVIDTMYDATVLEGLYDDTGKVIWPAG
ncbi:MAG: ABC transporter substrate-binding protein [Actinomycetota bacterium]|nr:ABC transporter substrate-binding protein [Actinomycetota bacterium]